MARRIKLYSTSLKNALDLETGPDYTILVLDIVPANLRLNGNMSCHTTMPYQRHDLRALPHLYPLGQCTDCSAR